VWLGTSDCILSSAYTMVYLIVSLLKENFCKIIPITIKTKIIYEIEPSARNSFMGCQKHKRARSRVTNRYRQ
jgi:hypothetical protein